MKWQPLGDQVIVERIKAEGVTKGGIVLPDAVREKPQKAKVLAVGPGRMGENGLRLAMDVKVGDTIWFARYTGAEVEIDEREILFLSVDHILAREAEE